MHPVRTRLGDDVGEAGRSTPDFGGHPPRARANLLHRVHVEVGEGGASHFGIGAVGAVHGEYRRRAALPVHRELLREVGRAAGIGHGTGRQQQQLAEIALVQGHSRDGLGGQLLPAGALAGFRTGGERKRALRR